MNAIELEAWRKRLKWKKARAAREIGVSRNAYTGYEAGQKRITKTVALACAAVLHGLPPVGAPPIVEAETSESEQ